MSVVEHVRADEIRPGDEVVLPSIGTREVLEAEASTYGIRERPCVRIVYAVHGGGASWENKATARGQRSRYPRTEGCLRPLEPHELYPVVRRRPDPAPDGEPAEVVSIVDRR